MMFQTSSLFFEKHFVLRQEVPNSVFQTFTSKSLNGFSGFSCYNVSKPSQMIKEKTYFNISHTFYFATDDNLHHRTYNLLHFFIFLENKTFNSQKAQKSDRCERDRKTK